MPTSLQRLTCCVALAAAIQAGAATAGTIPSSAPAAAPSASEEMLRLWQLRDTIDPAPQPVTPFDAAGETGTAAFDAPSRTWRLESPALAAAPRSTGPAAPGSRSMTPNLDRLLQRSYQPLVPSDAPRVTSTATRAPWGGQAYSKSGSTTVSGNNNNPHGPPSVPPGHRGGHDDDPSTPTPEPATMLLFGGAAAAAAGIRKRRQRK